MKITGHVYRRKDTGKFGAYVRVNGKKLRQESGFSTKTEARDALRDWETRLRSGTYTSPETERETRTLREAADDRLRAVEAELVALGVEKIVELLERLAVGSLAAVLRGHPVPRETRRAGHRVRAAREHGGELAVGVDVGEQRAEIALVGAVAVHEQDQSRRA